MLKKISGKFSTLESFVGFCHNCMFAGRARKGIRLSTIHQFKGLEAREVFILDVHSGNIPHKRSNDLNEEKRIFFVAVSRAKEDLHIFSVGKSSPFVPYLSATDWD